MMTPVPRISPGRLTALWVVLRSIVKLGEVISVEELLAFSRRSGLRCGGLPIAEGFALAVHGGFLTTGDPVRLTGLGREALERGSEEEPTQDVLRLFVSALVLRYPPSWVAYWQGDPDSAELVVPESTREVLSEADLLRPAAVEDLEVWAWWDALRSVPLAEETAGLRKAIGDAAEELSLSYERNRLRAEGFPYLAERVRWLARESAAYGFDILSFSGRAYGITSPDAALAVEVKGMALVARDAFRFHVSLHEWRTAQTLSARYIFHLWDGVHPGADCKARLAEPIIVRADALAKHLPSAPPCGETCSWESSIVSLVVGLGKSAPA